MAYPLREVRSAFAHQRLPFIVEDEVFTGTTESAVVRIHSRVINTFLCSK